MTVRTENYSVQPIGAHGEPVKNICIHVEAKSPVHAAELVLGEALVTQGKPQQARAIVWRLGDDYQPVSTTLFALVSDVDGGVAQRPGAGIL